MALRVDYLIRETGQNLVRNPSLVIATVLTVAVSLSLLGAALVIRQGVEGMNDRFKGDVQFLIWVDADVTDDQLAALERAMTDSPGVKEFRYVNTEETWVEFTEFWKDQPELFDVVAPEDMPTSYRVVPEIVDLAVVQALGRSFEGLPGVRKIDYASEAIERLNNFTRAAANIMLAAAIAAAVASGLLMYNSIRTAVFARRREIEVMRLVGANNSFIRLPFMFEGLAQGVVGAGFSALAVFGLNRLIRNALDRTDSRLFDSFALDSSQLAPLALILLGVGAVLGAIGSGVAVTRYLDA